MSGAPVGNRVAADASGNVYVTGGFSGTAQFGTTNLTSGGTIDVYLAKYDSAGNFLWAQQAKGTGGYESAGRDICADNKGNVYVAGNFQGPSILAEQI
jgi:hypothetical protein